MESTISDELAITYDYLINNENNINLKLEDYTINKNIKYLEQINEIISEIENYNISNFNTGNYPYFTEEKKTNFIPKLSQQSEIINN